MKLLVATDAHIFETPDGKHWCKSIYDYKFWTRYLGVFDEVRVVARVKKIEKTEGRMLLSDGPGVEFFGIPFFQGPKQLAKQFFAIQKRLKNVDEGCDVALMRMPSQTAQMTYMKLRKDITVAGEIVYNPSDDVNIKNGIISYGINSIISAQLKSFCKKANGVSYVTEQSIQRKYPSYAKLNGADERHFETYYSTITLSDDAFFKPRDFSGKKALTAVLSDVAMNSDRKGEKTLFNMMKILIDKGYDISAIIIGDGSKKQEYIEMTKALGIRDKVNFVGLLASSDAVREVMMDADIFVFPTRGEGLPRGILEAMAIGLPVLSTPVGGIPEVIDQEYLFSPDDAEGFAKVMMRLFDDTTELNAMSEKNYKKSLEFKNSILQKKREDFYTKLKNVKERT